MCPRTKKWRRTLSGEAEGRNEGREGGRASARGSVFCGAAIASLGARARPRPSSSRGKRGAREIGRGVARCVTNGRRIILG